ncbi:TetR/AcrR family transcriptional regulator [Streptomyces sp. NPDC006307]|uniref:TetR/AcrR family transcriptional regulator n=1 Tax=Streptomyces sp. NPDC006307 TaxID=3156748 RepID=UPI0033AE38EF
MAKQERARRTREKVLTAAAEVFASEGYSRATLGAVAERIGMTKGALYGHFPSKKSLAGALIAESRHAWTSLRAECDTSGADAGCVLEGVVTGFSGRLQSDVRLRATVRLAADCPVLARALSDVLVEVHDVLMDLVRRAQRDSGFPAHSPRLVARLLVIVMYGLLHAPAGSAGDEGAPGGEPLWRLLFAALSGVEGQGSVRGGGEAGHGDEAFSGAKKIPSGTNFLTCCTWARACPGPGGCVPARGRGGDTWEEADERAGRVDRSAHPGSGGPRRAGAGSDG